MRSRAEIEARIAALREDAAADPISGEEVALLDAVTRVRDTSDKALSRLQALAGDMPAIAHAVSRLARRLEALSAAGIDPASLDFEGSYGRTQMEYYDGFVFGFYAPNSPDMPPVATGGRYDALTRHLGAGREIPAVGGVIRPGLLVELGGGA